MSNDMIIGIDLGTTYSCLAYVDANGKIKVLSNVEGENTTPSVILFQDSETVLVGSIAKEMAAEYPDEQYVEAIKRHMGEDYKLEILGNEYKPPELSKLILEKLINDYKAIVPDADFGQVVITHPAYFGEAERFATKQAAIILGIPVEKVELIDEPTAAALADASESEGDKTIMVYDLGGGTFDVSILRCEGTEFRNLATEGDKLLGGKDWDYALFDLIKNKVEEASGGEVTSETFDLYADDARSLRFKCEGLKKRLTAAPSVSEKVVVGPMSYPVTVTREEFESVTAGKVQDTIDIVEKCLQDSNISIDDIDEIVLVGGSTRMPMIKDALEAKFPGATVRRSENPDEAVAKGAAIYSHSLCQGNKPTIPGPEPIVKRIMSKSYGIMALQGDKEIISNVLFRGTELPISVDKQFRPQVDGQTEFDIRVYENQGYSGKGDVMELSDCTEIGNFLLEVSEGTKLSDTINVTFIATKEGLITCKAECLGVTRDIELTPQNAMTDEEVKRATNRVTVKTQSD